MKAFVYRSGRRADTYVWLAARDGFERLPPALAASLGSLTLVLEVELGAGRVLPREDARTVRANLAECGFHLQLPPPPETAT